MRRCLIIVFLLLCIVGCSSGKKDNIIQVNGLITASSVKTLYDNKMVTIIDVRTEDEYKEKHILGAVNVPLSNIEKVEDIINDKGKNIVVYCKSGNRSKTAKTKLEELGFTSVYDLGSINNWTYDYEI